MTKQEFLSKLGMLLEADAIRGDERLSSFERWDSLAIMGFISIIDEELSVTVPAEKIISASSIADLVLLVQHELDG